MTVDHAEETHAEERTALLRIISDLQHRSQEDQIRILRSAIIFLGLGQWFRSSN